MDIHVRLTLFLVALNGFFVAAEFAIVKVRASQLQVQHEAGSKHAWLAKHLTEHLDEYLSATQLGITLASLGLGWVGEEAFSDLILAAVDHFGGNISITTAHAISLPIAFFLITFLHIVFGELAPKSLAIRRPVSTSIAIARPLMYFYKLFRPLIWLFNASSNLVLRLCGIKSTGHSEAHSEDELRLLLTESEEHGTIAEGSNELIQNVFDFDDRIVRHIYVPRSKVSAIDIDENHETNVAYIIDEWYSRIPVYQDDMDTIIGIVHAKDLFKKMRSGTWRTTEHMVQTGHDDPLQTFSLKDIIRPALVVPLTQKIEVLLKEFQRSHQQIAIVKNEHGETAGIVTMEDIIEELIGDIQDEHDEEQPLIIEKKPGVYIVKTEAMISDLNDVLPSEIPESDAYDTVGGLVLMLFGKIPHVYETVRFGGYEITVLKKTDYTVELVRWRAV